MTVSASWSNVYSPPKHRREVAQRTMAFEFQKPPDWTFTAGYFVDITLPNPPETDSEGNTRGFSVASAPCEATIMVTTRMRVTAFKRVLKSIRLDSEAKIEGPFGELTLHDDVSRPAVLLTRGVGVTTFPSIVFQAAHLKASSPHFVVLLQSPTRGCTLFG